MLSYITFRLISWVMAKTRAGDIRPTLMLDHDDVKFVFPGDNSWSGTFDGKAEHQRWLERLVRVGVKTEPDEVVASGFPWNSRGCIRRPSGAASPQGGAVAAHRFAIFGRLPWAQLADD